MFDDHISLRLHGHLARYAGEKLGALRVAIGPAETLAELIQRFKIPPAEISMIVVNGQLTSGMDRPLHPDDEVKIFGLVGGG